MKVAHYTPYLLRRRIFEFFSHKKVKMKITGQRYYTFDLLKHRLTSTPSYFLYKYIITSYDIRQLQCTDKVPYS